ncbi:MAG: double-strand break repair helicase AddA [Paracoccaceae bacterium]
MNDASQRQQAAAHPRRSTWLAANAGSGKTRVLTDRVARLLFDGVLPQHILCLTYTKAAASEMQNRLFKRLGEWAMLGDAELHVALRGLGLTRDLDASDLAQARTLFARAIETPGGLKIQTIHSFCAALLRRFPLEAGVSPQFVEIEERAADLLREDVVDTMAAGPDQPLLKQVARFFTGADFGALTKEIVNNAPAFAEPMDAPGYLRLFGHPETLTHAQIEAQLGGRDGLTWLKPLMTELRMTKGTWNERSLVKLERVAHGTGPLLPDLINAVLTAQGTVSSQFCTKKVQTAVPEAFEDAMDVAEQVIELQDAYRALVGADRSAALSAFGAAFLKRYTEHKHQRGWLDFDDLIGKARALLSDKGVAAWVLYRIDGGIDHILVDEAQDTSPTQWDVIWKLAEEFAAGEGARTDTLRTIFVVGDQKQSIYSFQGADPREFDRMKLEFKNRLEQSGEALQETSLDHSFRSSSAILSLVDTVFEDRGGPGFPKETKHIAFHEQLPGRVDLWPPVPVSDEDESGPWYEPVDRLSRTHHNRILAQQVAQEIKRMIDDKVALPSAVQDGVVSARPVQPSDFLILVRRRSGIFPELIRACKEEQVPIAGADVLRVGAELAVRDIGALLSFLATPEDDLSLATILKSPLFGWSEDQLFRLAHGRGRKHLWQVLRDKGAEFPETVSILMDLREHSDFLRPYDLMERLLTRHKGRQKLLGRLGVEAEDGIDALLDQALAYERNSVPSLTGFLAWMETDDLQIKRQIDSASNQVRIMTVHGSKGLEAPIVILPDTAQRGQTDRSNIAVFEDHAVWKPSSKETWVALQERVDDKRAAQDEESLRLLYVALTRAEKWLIVAAAGKRGSDDAPDWYQIIEEGADKVGAATIAGPVDAIKRIEVGDWSKFQVQPAELSEHRASELPDFAFTPYEQTKTQPQTLSPSDLGGAKALSGEGLNEDTAKAYGRLVHELLERFPGQDLERCNRIFDNAGGQVALSEDLKQDARRGVERILSNPEFTALFQPDTLSEVSITADVEGKRIHGTIDKLLVTPDRVLAVDFKTNRVVPNSPDKIPEGVLRQLGAYAAALTQIYPDTPIETAVLWTETETFMSVAHDIVTDALRRSQYLDVTARPT